MLKLDLQKACNLIEEVAKQEILRRYGNPLIDKQGERRWDRKTYTDNSDNHCFAMKCWNKLFAIYKIYRYNYCCVSMHLANMPQFLTINYVRIK